MRELCPDTPHCKIQKAEKLGPLQTGGHIKFVRKFGDIKAPTHSSPLALPKN